MRKKLLALFLSVCMVIGLMPMSTVIAFATEDFSAFEGEGFTLSTTGDYPWEIVEKDEENVLAATHGEEQPTLSTLAVSFSETGVFSFDYSTNTDRGRNILYYSLA